MAAPESGSVALLATAVLGRFAHITEVAREFLIQAMQDESNQPWRRTAISALGAAVIKGAKPLSDENLAHLLGGNADEEVELACRYLAATQNPELAAVYLADVRPWIDHGRPSLRQTARATMILGLRGTAAEERAEILSHELASIARKCVSATLDILAHFPKTVSHAPVPELLLSLTQSANRDLASRAVTILAGQEDRVDDPMIHRLLRQTTLSDGADFFGVADLGPARTAIETQGGESLADFPRAVSIGVALPRRLVDQLVQQPGADVARDYEQVYNETNRKLDQLASAVAKRLQGAGATALVVCASRRIDQHRLCGLFSHKMAAHLAGLGWIGKSCLLVTREAGPRVRWVTVLTDALLPPTGSASDQACGGKPAVRGSVPCPSLYG